MGVIPGTYFLKSVVKAKEYLNCDIPRRLLDPNNKAMTYVKYVGYYVNKKHKWLKCNYIPFYYIINYTDTI